MLFIRIALLLLGLTLPLAIGEVYLRAAHPIASDDLLPYRYQYDALRRIIAGETFISFDRKLGWKPTAGVSRRFEGVTYSTNQAGLRAERDFAPGPPPGIRRIAAFGDSYTYCENVAYADCWTARLERSLTGVEVMNFGVPAYGIDQAWLRYQQEGPEWHPCTVLIGYMVENINRVVNRFRPFYKPPEGFVLSKPRFLLGGGDLTLLDNPVDDPRELLDPRWVETTLGPNDRWYFPGVFVANPLDMLQSVRVARTAAYRYRREGEINFHADLARQTEEPYRTQGEAFQVTGRILLGFYREVERSGAQPIVIVFGTRPDIETLAAGQPKAYQPILDWLDREAVAYVDVTDDLAQEARRSNLRSVIANHYRPLGNEIVSRKLARELRARPPSSCDSP